MSDADVEEAVDEIATLLWELEYGVRHFSRVVDDEAKVRKHASLVDNFEKTKNKLKWLQYSLKMMDSGPAKDRFLQRAEEIEEKTEKYKPLIDALEPDKKASLLKGPHTVIDLPKFIPTATFSTQQPLLPSETTAELTKKTRNLQDDSFVRLERTTQTLDDTIHLGTDTTHKLRRQGEQLTALTPHLEAASMNVKTANKQTRRLLKLLACDRVSVILFLLILILVGAIIALLVLQAQGKIVLPL